ncbi:hypothetical protein [Haloglomus litoreum]|uniref:hypothetical protein n=1 Tax=Haloglomus litoreum TaxID=3034026 RepID=UPI0023E80207|nr:hypothetical protein [Haloglomus sp. DT116]
MISRRKLERWTNSGTADQEEARDTHREIRDELSEGSLQGVSDGLEFTTYLQGSYRNTTMVYDSGDVDILVIRTDTYHADFSEAPATSTEVAPARNPRQMFDEHAEGVYRTLQAQYGARNIERGEKAIGVESDDLPLGADVVPCLQYRRFWTRQPGNHMKGIVFWADDGTKIVNFPRRHRIMGERYNEWCDGNYKATIRIFKNFRNALVERGTIDKEVAPSYFIECLLSNVEVTTIAEDDIRERVEGILQELESDAEDDFAGYTVQHGMQSLFGEETTQWDVAKAREFVEASQTFYNED